jgi:two-component system chemotaxis response regulator CheB
MQSQSRNNSPAFVVVVGSSAGGLTALTELISQLKPGMDAAVFIVIHLSRKGIGDFLVHRLQQFTSLPCEIAAHGASIKKEHIYIAPHNHHLLVKESKMIIGYGPEENRWRPSIDVLFRSAAVAYGNHAIGIVITGLLDDGTAGMVAIKKCGGICIVQDPKEAEYPEMPLSVLNHLDADYCISLAEMGLILQELTRNGIPKKIEVPEELAKEAMIAEKTATGIDVACDLGDQTVYACPDCGGTMWNITREGISRYRCHIGHSYSENDLILKQASNLESTLWVALRMMEDRKNLLNRLANDTRKRGAINIAAGHEEKSNALQQHINKLKEILFSTQVNNP